MWLSEPRSVRFLITPSSPSPSLAAGSSCLPFHHPPSTSTLAILDSSSRPLLLLLLPSFGRRFKTIVSVHRSGQIHFCVVLARKTRVPSPSPSRPSRPLKGKQELDTDLVGKGKASYSGRTSPHDQSVFQFASSAASFLRLVRVKPRAVLVSRVLRCRASLCRLRSQVSSNTNILLSALFFWAVFPEGASYFIIPETAGQISVFSSFCPECCHASTLFGRSP